MVLINTKKNQDLTIKPTGQKKMISRKPLKTRVYCTVWESVYTIVTTTTIVILVNVQLSTTAFSPQ